MLNWRSLILLLAPVFVACTEPNPRQPWVAGAWAVADTFELQYTLVHDIVGNDTVTFQVAGYRTLTVHLTPVTTDAMRRDVAGRAAGFSRSSALGDFFTYDDTLYFSDTLRVTATHIYGQYVSAPVPDSLAFPAVETSEIHWNADNEALCNFERAGYPDSDPNLVPGSFSCRLRVHWRRP